MTGHTEQAKIPEAAKIVLIPLIIIGFIMLLMRFIFGLNLTNMNDGYPWGIWITIDVVIGTALGTGGYAMAILIYLFNKWEYHPLLKPALMTSLLGYTLAGASVIVDLGRWWNFFSILNPLNWNHTSVMLEVALCIMGYTVVTFMENLPFLAEKAKERNKFPGLLKFAAKNKKLLNIFLILIVSIGILLPTMHQSSLGTMMVIASAKLHPLWHSALMPLLYIISVLFTGYGVVIIECAAISKLYKVNRPEENKLLIKIGTFISIIAVIWIVLRLSVTALEGKIATLSSSGYYSVLYASEIILMAIAAVMIIIYRSKRNLKITVSSAVMLLIAGSLYRLNSYLIAFNPGKEFFYFPSAVEILITAGIFSLEIFLYLASLKYLSMLLSSGKVTGAAFEKPDFFASSSIILAGKRRYILTTVTFTMVFVITAVFLQFSGLPVKADNPVKKSIGWDMLKIDGNRNGKFVNFNHKKHQSRIGRDEARCRTCHHLSMPKDGPSSCYLCHTDMYKTTSVFDHNYHVKIHAKNSCRECHMGNDGQKQDVKPCGHCHKTNKNEIQYEKDIQYYLNARSYKRAMHGKCLLCHKTEDKKTEKITLSKCSNCHGTNL